VADIGAIRSFSYFLETFLRTSEPKFWQVALIGERPQAQPNLSKRRTRRNENLETDLWLAVILIASLATVTHSLSKGASPVLASSAQNGQLHITKLCPDFHGAAGDHCTIATSNLAELPPGTTVYYDQAFGIPAGNLDSNVMLFVSSGNWAVGRCTVEAATLKGLCTALDGVGPLAGFTARVEVVIDPVTGVTSWDGTYRFEALPNR
jgi:hypothetical protein